MAKACKMLEHAGLVRRPGREDRATSRRALDYQVNPRLHEAPGPVEDAAAPPANPAAAEVRNPAMVIEGLTGIEEVKR